MPTNEIPVDMGLFAQSKIKSCFIESVGQALSNLSDQDAKIVRSKLITLIGEMNPMYILSKDFIVQVSDKIFEDELFRDWIFSTRFIFFMGMAAHFGQSMVGFVIDSLACSASLDLGAEDCLDNEQKALFDSVVVSPPQIAEELLTYRQAKVMIAANSWLVVIMLSLAYISLDHEVLEVK